MKRERMENIKDVVVELKDGSVLSMANENSIESFIENMPYELKNEIFKSLEKENFKEDIKVSIDHLKDIDEIPTINLSEENYLSIIELLERGFDANIDYNSQIEEAIKTFLNTYNI